MRYAVLALALALSGCGTRIAPFSPDKEFLQRCSPPTRLEGLTGASIIAWAEVNGPSITECVRIHNALVTVIEVQAE